MKVGKLIELLNEEDPDANIFILDKGVEIYEPAIADNSRTEDRSELLIVFGDIPND